MASYIANSNLTSTLAAQNANFVPLLWKKGAELSEQNEDYWQEFEGKGLKSPIRVETDFAKDAGQTIYFRTREGLYNDGVIGDELIGDGVEQWVVGAYSLSVDYIRHAVRRNQRTEDQTALRAEIEEGVNTDLGEWLGRKKTKHLSMMMRENLDATSQVFASADGSSKTSMDDLKSADVVSIDGIINWGQILKTKGGLPADISRDRDNPIPAYIVSSTGEALVSLKTASDYKQAQREANTRGTDNVIFKGGFTRIDGHVIKEYNPIDHAGQGAIGSAQNPKAKLGIAIAAADTLGFITGGGNATNGAVTQAKYFEFFRNFAYRFTPNNILAGGSTERYCLIYNLTDSGAGDANKMGFYAFTVNDGNKLTVTKRLRAAGNVVGGAIAYTTIGGVTWNSGVWAGKHTDAHPAGSLVIECNSYGVPFGYTFVLGAQAALRGYGRFRNERTTQTYEGGFVKDVFITSVFGQAPKQRSDGVTPNILRVAHAIQYAGLSIPNVV